MNTNPRRIALDALLKVEGDGAYSNIVLGTALRDSGLSAKELADWIEENKLNMVHWFFSTDLTYYIKGGRISKTAGTIGQVLNICPLLNVDKEGRLTPREKIRTKKKVVKRIVEKMVEEAEGGINYTGKVFLSDTDQDLGAQVENLIAETFPQLKGRIARFDIGCPIGSHTGPGTVRAPAVLPAGSSCPPMLPVFCCCPAAGRTDDRWASSRYPFVPSRFPVPG